ncbi:host attachment family protein [uncultured Sphingomonas sp.]|uniref:host attachment family protein n=1 Tax=uncultured Sphingomonas sp. TaxID=158754 RepID=UPI0025F19EA7|nr:host attachment family protein [uncultured Sphingomonas sp.]
MRVPHDSYVLVADGAKMLFFRNEGDAEAPNLQVVAAEQQADAYDRDIKTDTAGQKPGIPGGPGGASIGETDFHQQAEDRFAAEAAERINSAALAGEFQNLIVVASPKTLGELRKHYGKHVQDKITAEIAKDLTGHPVDRIEAALMNYEA